METIRPFTDEDCSQVQRLHLEQAKKNESKYLLQTLCQRSSARRTWQAGLVGLAGVQVSQVVRTGQSSVMLMILEMALWSAGVGLAWSFWIRNEYWRKAQQQSKQMTNDWMGIKKKSKSNVWVMVRNSSEVVGAVALRCEDGEGKIQSLTGAESKIELALVQNAIQFARQQGIKVITKC
ncbi:hypothetical protein EC973_005911 [Apophysomyces ossiformis]|uniref:Uncharacterized protein n=1 Tax=Apophysomyces ossiformis TaxID=679940 RepID=A0A8H7EL41_9FUNG|nr:hypothetical protein EC973_005911 [Apophysomyces ossiformis]